MRLNILIFKAKNRPKIGPKTGQKQAELSEVKGQTRAAGSGF